MDTFAGSDINKRKLTEDDHQIHHPRKHLRVEIPSTIFPSTISAALSSTASPSSLFSAISPAGHDLDNALSMATSTPRVPALLIAPPISGLYFEPGLKIPADLADSIFTFCMSTYFCKPDINQIMLFTRLTSSSTSALPPILNSLLDTLFTLLKPHIPVETHNLLFPAVPTQARQVILNLYSPGEGISSHVDLLKRFGDGIIGVSLGSGCVMRFAQTGCTPDSERRAKPSICDEPVHLLNPIPHTKGSVDNEVIYDLYLPERSVLVLSSDARYKWTHGIEKRKSDFISRATGSSPGTSSASEGHWVQRGTRLSITYRWLLPEADIVGNDILKQPGLDNPGLF